MRLGDLGDLSPRFRDMTRAQIAAQMAAAPSPSALGTAEDRAFILANADLIRDDWAEVIADVGEATNVGKRRRLWHVAIGAVAGGVVGAVAYRLIGGR